MIKSAWYGVETFQTNALVVDLCIIILLYITQCSEHKKYVIPVTIPKHFMITHSHMRKPPWVWKFVSASSRTPNRKSFLFIAPVKLLIYFIYLFSFPCPQSLRRWQWSRDHSRRRATAWRLSTVARAATLGRPSTGGRTWKRCRRRWAGTRSLTRWLVTARLARCCALSRPGRPGITRSTSVSPRTAWVTQSARTPS